MVAASSVVNTIFLAFAFYMYQRYNYKRPVYRPVGDLRDAYDYIIVGGGSAGCALAARLSEDQSMDVLLLEAGPSDVDHAQLHTPFRAGELVMSELDWSFFSTPQTTNSLGMEGKRAFLPRGKVLGGSSQTNYMQWSRGHRLDYNKWAELGCDGWSYEDVLTYFVKSEGVIPNKLKDKGTRGEDGPVKITQTYKTGIAEQFINAIMSLGFPIRDYNDGDQEGVALTQTNIYKGERWSSARAYLWPAAERENLDIVTNAHVNKILFSGKKAIGVEFTRQQSDSTAAQSTKLSVLSEREVILSAGVFGSPQILMLSGIGPKDHLESLGIPVISNLPVGHNLQDHLIFYADVETNVSVSQRYPSTYNQLEYQIFGSGPMSEPCGNSALAYLPSTPGLEQPDLQLTLYSGPIDKKFLRLMPGVSADILESWSQNPKPNGFFIFLSPLNLTSKGRVTLRDSNPRSYPLIDAAYLTEPTDLDVIVKGIRLIQSILRTPSMQKYDAKLHPRLDAKCSHSFKKDTDQFWKCVAKHMTASAHHSAGTCKMGAANDNTAVVDSRLRVKGVSGLRVADASIMPEIVSANTNAPTIMIAEKAADMIKEDAED